MITPSDVGRMPFDEVQLLFRYWQDNPPAHLLLRMMSGFEPRGSRTTAQASAEHSAQQSFLAAGYLKADELPAYVKKAFKEMDEALN